MTTAGATRNAYHSSVWVDLSAADRRRDLCRTSICTSDKFLARSSSDYLGFRGSLTFFISSSSPLPHISQCFFPALASLLTPFTFFLFLSSPSVNSCDKVSPQGFSSVLNNIPVEILQTVWGGRTEEGSWEAVQSWAVSTTAKVISEKQQ